LTEGRGKIYSLMLSGRSHQDLLLHSFTSSLIRSSAGLDIEDLLCDDSPQLQAVGFLNDMAVSSHGDSSVQPHERAITRKQLMYRLAQQTLARSCFYPGERFSLEPANTIKLSVCERTTELFFSSCEKAVAISPPAGGAAFIPRAEAQGLTPRFGKP